MRIGLLTTSFPRWPGDVAGQFVHGFAAALVARGHSLEVLAPEPAEAVQLPVFEGIEVRWLPYLRPRGLQRTFYGAGVPDNLRARPSAWLGLLPFSAAMTSAVLERRAHWDAIVSHFGLPCGLIAGALRQHRPHLCVQHSADLHALALVPGGTRLARVLAARSSALWFVSERARAAFLQQLPAAERVAVSGRCTVQAMGIDPLPTPTAERRELRARLGIERFALLTVARLVPIKGLPAAVRALAHRGDLEWLIAGDGPERGELAALAASLDGASLRVRLLGQVVGADKAALLHAADAFVLPSRVLPSGRSEGAPTALLEAMAAGLPVIAADVGGVGELLAGGERGWPFDSHDRSGLEAALVRMQRSPQQVQACAEAARAFAARHSWTALAPKIEACLTRQGAEPDTSTAPPASPGPQDHESEREGHQPERASTVVPIGR